jgi:hypothetical protein
MYTILKEKRKMYEPSKENELTQSSGKIITLKIKRPEKIFKQIPGYPDYTINEDGTEIISYRRSEKGKMISIKEKHGKNPTAQLISHKRLSIISLVALTFIPNPYNFPLIRHIGDETNHHYTNLEWWSGSSEHKFMQWKDIHLEYYMVSEYGDIITKRGLYSQLLKTYKRNVDDIRYIKLAVDKTNYYCLIHYLVASAFLPNPAGYQYVLHIGDQNNNHYSNLKWSKTPFLDIEDLEWKTLEEFPNYRISEKGHLVSVVCNTPVLLSTVKRASGIQNIAIPDKNQVRRYVRTEWLVAKAFIENPNNYEHIVHLDNDINNNHYKNLVWSITPDLPLNDGIEWRDIPGFPDYKISSLGTIKSYKSNIPYILKKSISSVGYAVVSLYKGPHGYRFRTHRLVALIFIPNPKNYPIADHIDKNKENNNVANLRWVTYKQNSENIDRNPTSNWKEVAKIDMDGNIIDIYRSGAEAEKQFGIQRGEVGRCARGQIKTAGGFIWQYINDDEEEPYLPQDGETFKPIIGYYVFDKINYPNYQISNFGTLINITTGLKRRMVDNVYGIYSLCIDGISRSYAAHILVASFFVDGKTEERCFVNHRDEDKLNPHYLNLEWVTQKENVNYSVNRKKYSKIIQDLNLLFKSK